jgi:2-haloacid dehalogenase
MNHSPTAVAFDVVETLFALDPVQERLTEAGLPSGILPFWFATFLRDALAMDAAGTYASFEEVAKGSLHVVMLSHGVEPTKAKIASVIDAFAELPAHPDVAPAFEKLRAAGVRIATLTNGSAKTTQRLLERAGVEKVVSATISIDEVKRWKPAREVYMHAAKTLDVEASKLALVAAHGWDVHGAKVVGLVTGFVARKEKAPSPTMKTPDVQGASLVEVVERLLG